jgi:hypothetical protein
MRGIHLSGVVRALSLLGRSGRVTYSLGKKTYGLDNLSAACRSESLDSEVLALFHLCGIVALDQAHRFSSMNLVLVDGVAAEVGDGFHREYLSTHFDLIRLHGFLDITCQLSELHINTRFLP